MDAAAIATTLSQALEFLRQGEHRRARACLAPLGADRIDGAPLPRCAWIVRLIELGQVDEAQAELEALIAQSRTSPVALAPLPALVVAAIAIYGKPTTAADMGLQVHELKRIVPGATLGPDEPMMRAGLLALLNGARAA
jgi:hypothetical protein